ncbi:MAG: DNA repair protein RadC [Lachnospiraceae bacterium]|nr:DNA repair protein RadC [Lachnospiraceae bacterium]
MNHHNNDYSELPYERFVRYGASALSEGELLAIIIRTGTKDKNAVDIAREILSMSQENGKGLIGLYDLTIDELSKIKGVGSVKAIKLKALAELSMRMHKECARQSFNACAPETVARYFMEDMRHLDYEQVILAAIDAKGNMISHKVLSVGSVNQSLLSPRTVFLESLRMKAVYIILLHNHPSGNPDPSETDIKLTKNIEELGEKLEVRLLDHIVIGDNCYYSFRENNLLEFSL